MKPDALPTHTVQLEAAYRHSAALATAIAAGKHDCHCGAFGAFRFPEGREWFCGAHVERGADRVPVRGIGAGEVREARS